MRQGRIVAAGLAALLASVAPAALAATTELVSVDSAGRPLDGNSFAPSVSGDGSRVAFESRATNLGGDGFLGHVYLRDLKTGRTTAVDLSPSGGLGNGDAFFQVISRDGSHVAFASYADDLVPGDTNGQADVFVRDLTTGTTVRASVRSNGTQAHNRSSYPDAISANGRFVAFETSARNLTRGPKGLNCIFVRDVAKGRTVLVSRGLGGQLPNGPSDGAAMSDDGRFVAFASDASNLVEGDTNGKTDIFLFDRLRGTTVRVSVGPSGEQANGGSLNPQISADGSVIAFDSDATNLAPRSPDGGVMVRDLKAGTTTRIDRATDGGEPMEDGNPVGAGFRSMSADGRYFLLYSYADNLVAHDTNGAPDLFLADRRTGRMVLVDLTASGAQPSLGAGLIGTGSVSADGSVVAFDAPARDLATVLPKDLEAVFVRVLGGATGRP